MRCIIRRFKSIRISACHIAGQSSHRRRCSLSSPREATRRHTGCRTAHRKTGRAQKEKTRYHYYHVKGILKSYNINSAPYVPIPPYPSHVGSVFPNSLHQKKTPLHPSSLPYHYFVPPNRFPSFMFRVQRALGPFPSQFMFRKAKEIKGKDRMPSESCEYVPCALLRLIPTTSKETNR